jgi:anti-anti-sigma regulatory factor
MRIGAIDAPAAVVSSNVLVAIVNASGAIDAAGATRLDGELGRALDAGATRIIVDLTHASDTTTACMNALLAARQRLVSVGGQVAVALSPRIRTRFETLGLGRRFLLATDRSDAARKLGLIDGGARRPAPSAPRHAHAT